MTVGLLAVVVYLYTVVAFNFFRKFYNMSEDEDEPDMKCDDMMTVSVSPHISTFSSITLYHFMPDCDHVFSLSVISSTCTWVCELVVV